MESKSQLKVRLIGLSGKLGSGKSSAAKILMRLCPGFVERAFAHRLKEIVAVMTQTSVEFCYTEDGKNTVAPAFGKTIGELQQGVGIIFRETYGADIWIKCLFADYDRLMAMSKTSTDTPGQQKPSDRPLWIVSDVRFPNEVKAIKDRGGIVVRIEGDPMGVRARSKRDLKHISETALDTFTDWDVVIDNSVANMEQFEYKIKSMVLPKLK